MKEDKALYYTDNDSQMYINHINTFFLLCFYKSKKNVLQGKHESDKLWSKEGFYAVIIFLSIFVVIVTCLMVSLLVSIVTVFAFLKSKTSFTGAEIVC